MEQAELSRIQSVLQYFKGVAISIVTTGIPAGLLWFAISSHDRQGATGFMYDILLGGMALLGGVAIMLVVQILISVKLYRMQHDYAIYGLWTIHSFVFLIGMLLMETGTVGKYLSG